MSDDKVKAAPTVDELSYEDLDQGQLIELLKKAEANNGKLFKKVNQLQYVGNQLKSENQMLLAAPEVSVLKAEMDYQLSMAAQFSASKAFPNYNPEQIYVLMKAGKEMHLKEIEAMSALYIVNGQVGFHGKHLAGRFTSKGYRCEYKEESPEGVTVTVFRLDEEGNRAEEYTEVVKASDQILKKSKAMGFAAKNKMRYHGLRMIANFHLPHLFSSVTVWDQDDFDSAQKRVGSGIEERQTNQQIKRAYDAIEEATDPVALAEKFDGIIDALGDKELGEALENKIALLNRKNEENEEA